MTGLPPGRRVHQSINAIRQLEVTDLSAQFRLPSLMEHSRRRLRQWFHVKPASAPEKRLSCRPHQSRGARCHDRICRVSLTDGTRSVPPEADVSATFFRGSSTSYPVGHDVFTGRPLPGTGRRHHVAPHVLRHTPYLPPRKERASRLISSVESRLLRSVTSAESHGALPSDTSPLVSRETDSQTRRRRHGSADVIPRSALPG